MAIFFRIASFFLLLSSIAISQNQNPAIVRSASDHDRPAAIEAEAVSPRPIPLPAAPAVREIVPIWNPAIGHILKSNATGSPAIQLGEFLNSGEYCAFAIDGRSSVIDVVKPSYQLSPAAVQALDEAPLWLRDALRLKLIVLSKSGLDASYAQLILDAPEIKKDEVAFVIAYSSVSTLSDSRFSADKQMIARNADFIYSIADSLSYVKLVEHGSYAARDYYTTTQYRVYDPAAKDTVWNEIPMEYYYWYIVHPKMDQEGVYVRDNGNDASGQRTYGYSWRDFIWNNPDPAHNYTAVNVTTTKGAISTIPRFGDLLKQAPILWDRQKTYYPFNRNFTASQSALDVIGNWCSRAVPVDVVAPRAFQPNQILMKHNGMCNEDAFLIAGACRTALIPVIYLGSWAEDHAFGSTWDGDWNHYEFFRGGLAPGGNSFYGITNMLDRGSYGWKTSMVEGFRPDGFPLDFSKYYADTCRVNLTVTDSLGNPIDGAVVQIYAPYLYGSGYIVCGHQYTNRKGKVSFTAGEAKQYLVNVSHPQFGWSPKDSTQAYYLIQGQAATGATYNVTVAYANVKLADNLPGTVAARDTGSRYVHFYLNSTEIISGVNLHDGQRSRFYKWNSDADGIVSFFVCDSANFDLFQRGKAFSCSDYSPYVNGGNFYHYIPDNEKRYAVFLNSSSANVLEKVAASCEILDGTITSVERTTAPSRITETYPSPVRDACYFRYDEPIRKIEIFDMYGRIVRTVTGASVWRPGAGVSAGVYHALVWSARGVSAARILVAK